MIWLLPAGALTDRWSRKQIMLVADGRAVAMASVAVAVVLGRITTGHMIVAFVEGTLLVFSLLAETAALPRLVPKLQLPTAIPQNQARDRGADGRAWHNWWRSLSPRPWSYLVEDPCPDRWKRGSAR